MLSKAVARLTPSATLAITAKGKQLAATGNWVINFASGQPDFDTPVLVKNAAKKALDQGFTKYTPSSGIPELKQAICKKLLRDNNLRYSPDQILVSNGAKQALFEAIFALSQKGDEVIMPAPYWVSYPEMIKAAGAKPVVLQTGSNFKITPNSLAKVLTSKSKIFIFNAPSNPTGVMYTKQELYDIATLLFKKPNLWIISDECYDQFYYGKKAQISFATLGKIAHSRTITINSTSKTFSMTGWRIGYAAGDKSVISGMASLQSHLSSNPCSFAQKGAVAALLRASSFSIKMRKEFTLRRKTMVQGLNKISKIKAKAPDGAFYVFADISQITSDDMKFSQDFLDQEKVTVIPGSPFGASGYIRLSFAVSMKDIKEGLKRLNRYIDSL